jgi:hypothetical protein
VVTPAAAAAQAAQVRVTPQELSAALAAIEAKRDAQSRHAAETIAIGDAVEQLDLGVDAEELLREVEAARARQRAAAVPIRPALRVRRRPSPLLVAGLALIPLLLLFVLLMTSVRTVTPMQIASPAQVTGVQTAATYPLLSEVAEGQEVYADMQTLQAIAAGKSHSKIHVEAGPIQSPRRLWTLNKRDGKVLVNAWTASGDVLKLLNGSAATLYSAQEYSERFGSGDLRQVEVPVEKFRQIEERTHDETGETVGVRLKAGP